jgi:2-succinyl-5-enolpyruvyl-6-hydroxy-3-cyclohexene-1-carboxylate synthase
LYDINSLTILKNITNLIIVVVNNQGGRIFESLFEKDTSDKQVLEAITSQHNFDIESIVKSFDIQCKTVTDSFSFQQTLLNALKHNDVEIIHCLITSKDIQ